jgi:enoyl-CoA hydratase
MNNKLEVKKMNYEFIKYEIENKVAVITINRPPVNPLNTQVFKEIIDAMERLESDDNTNVIIITGNGEKAFVAGADLHEMINMNQVEILNMSSISRTALNKIENLSKPVIAAINGLALGGGLELALACDLRISSEKAKFAFPEVGLGIIPGAGGTQRLQKIVGQGLAKELLYFGDMFDAERALSLQIVNKVVPSSEVLTVAKEWGQKLAEKPSMALRMLKLSINAGSNVGLETGLTIEGTCFGNVFATEDRKEGMVAFVEKRKPNFIGR